MVTVVATANPDKLTEFQEILGDTPRGARLLYVAMTRAVQHLTFVTDTPPSPTLR